MLSGAENGIMAEMSLKMCCFASGSKGNCCYVNGGATNILIDLGISAMRAEKCLSAVGCSPDDVHIVVTHTHSDHIGGLKIFCKRHPSVKVYCQRECAAGMYRAGISPVIVERSFALGGVSVTAVPVPHDVPCFGYVISSGGKSVAVVTDVGRLDRPALDVMSGCGLVMLEANHDMEMLNCNPRYTRELKSRIASRYGHLSNNDCADACAYLGSRGVKNFILAHLSEENNEQGLAVSFVREKLENSGIADARIVAACQDRMTGLYEIC